MHFQECEIGFTYQNSEIFIFFGKANADLEKIKKIFPAYEFYGIKQIHSDRIVQASPTYFEADAHWTSEPLKALFILTADCIPLFIHNRKIHAVAAIHAGWRGVENHIVIKSLKQIMTPTSSSDDFEVWIGPHILKNSFEVQQDVLEALLKSSFEKNKNVHFEKKQASFFLDLKEIIDSQIISVFPTPPESHFLNLDTKTNLLFHSFRRDQKKAGRNVSFIVKLK